MASEEMNLVPSQRMENGLNSQIVFQDEGLQFNCGAPQRRVADPARKTREVSGFVEEKMFPVDRDRYFRTSGPEFRRGLYDSSPGRQDRPETQQNWNADASAGTPSIDGSEGEEEDEDDDEDDEDDEVDGEVEGLVAADDSNKNNNNSSSSVHSSSEKIRSEKSNLQKHHSSFGGSGRGVLVKDGNVVQSATSIRGSPSEQQHQQGRMTHCENAVTIAEPDMYYSQFFQGTESSVLAQKEIGENGCGFSGRKDGSLSTESGESLRTILSDPLTGTLMDDAMILPCGHSFGSGGMQHVIRMKACYTCSQSVSEDSVASNLTLRSAVQAFRREEELQSYRASKKRRERFEQDKYGYGDQFPADSRGRGVQFPFAVTDRVIIKGNKRTPQRFVGREAIVTTQCLNGWYVVKTLDNAESVKLQYRSLAKVSDNLTMSAMSSKTAPNWL
ncbi:PREDICTED: U-box domain-containing protein 62-like isoform X2 [Nelumbo nucifera]|uniref:U-box domain-containing protein 62-like isoform X2 n=1 Tax=Nelumbo nucifera TaxID=4432 RepID=A0A1U7ZK72_NELNU|nr:PREDICTED: U-box domain-containing protein 62-like isoform X2 [Nelumbo nucifera]